MQLFRSPIPLRVRQGHIQTDLLTKYDLQFPQYEHVLNSLN